MRFKNKVIKSVISDLAFTTKLSGTNQPLVIPLHLPLPRRAPNVPGAWERQQSILDSDSMEYRETDRERERERVCVCVRVRVCVCVRERERENRFKARGV